MTLKENFFGTEYGSLVELEEVINKQAQKGYRLHTFTTIPGSSMNFAKPRLKVTMVFEK
jgi:hypothetical protein